MTSLPAAVILAGGLGTRLRPVLTGLPKPLAPVRGVPFLQYLLDYLDAQGVAEAVLSIGYLGDLIEQRFGRRHGSMALRYCREESPLGTGGAIRRAWEQQRLGKAILAMNGDSFYPIPLQSLAAGAGQDPAIWATLALKPMQHADRYGTVRLDEQGRIRQFEEKGACSAGLINGGIYCLTDAFLQATPAQGPFSLERDFFEKQAPAGHLAGVVLDREFIDIGIPEDLERAQSVLPRSPCGDARPESAC